MRQYKMYVHGAVLEDGENKMKVNNEKELGVAVYNKEDTIEIEGNLATKVIKIKAKGKVA